MELFIAKILNSFKLLTIFAKQAPSQMFEWVKNKLPAKSLKYWALLPAYKLSRKKTQPENMCDVVFEKAKGCGVTVNRRRVYTEAAVRKAL